LLDPWRGRLVVIEVKLQHTYEAHDKLFQVYLPVFRAAFGTLYDVIALEVVRWYDCAVPCGRKPNLCANPLLAKTREFNVHIWEGF
jgi:hypothetical protein